MAPNIVPIICLTTLLQVISIHGHGNMVVPFSWHDTEGLGLSAKYPPKQVGCDDVVDNSNNIKSGNKCLNQWFTNYTRPSGDQTIPDSLLEYPEDNGRRPWHAPGTAPIYSPCGTAGGNPFGCSEGHQEFGDCCGGGGGGCGGYALGKNAQDYDYPGALRTTWPRGTAQDVAWWLNANHFGGYSYRLCKMPQQGRSGLTEECFQKTPLDFHGDYQWIKPRKPKGKKSQFAKTEAVRTRIGTFPPGSQWTKVDGVEKTFKGYIKDQVEVPLDIDEGEYVLSFRWDCEKSPQIWNICANIDIV